MRILVVRLSSFGDIVFTMPLAQALRSAFPLAELAWVVEDTFAPLLAGAAFVDRVITCRTRVWRRQPLRRSTQQELVRFRRELRDAAPDLLVDAQGLFKSAWVTALVPCGRKVGFGFRTATESVNGLVTDERVDARTRRHVVDKALALAEHVTGRRQLDRIPDVSHLAERPDVEVDDWIQRRSQPFAVLQPFSSVRPKEWPPERVRELARLLSTSGFTTVVRWGPGERERAVRMVEESGGLLELAPRTDPASTARLARGAALFVGADTGPTHLAAAAGTPTIALFGPSDPHRFGPIGPRTRILRSSGAHGSDLAKLTADDVFQAATELLANGP